MSAPLRKDSRNLKIRTLTTLIAIPVLIVLIWFDEPLPWFTIFGVFWGMGAAYEFYRIVAISKKISPLLFFGLIWVALFIIRPHISYPQTLHLLLTGMVVIPLIVLLWRNGKQEAFAMWAWTLAGILYVGWLLSYFIDLRNLDDGRGWVFLTIFCTFASDITAYLVGRKFGKHKLTSYISPNKTWEGAMAGIPGAVLLSLLSVWVFELPIGYGGAVLLGALVSVFGQLGGLINSLFKRNMGVKDSSQIIPGHGGLLDRMDSMAFAGLTVYLFVFYAVMGG